MFWVFFTEERKVDVVDICDFAEDNLGVVSNSNC